MECRNCNKPIENTPGRRPKIFCSDNCRAKHWQKLFPKKEITKPAIKEKVEKLKQVVSKIKMNPSGSATHEMPKGLSLTQQIDWKLNHGQ